jgi:hypothetical protein
MHPAIPEEGMANLAGILPIALILVDLTVAVSISCIQVV